MANDDFLSSFRRKQPPPEAPAVPTPAPSLVVNRGTGRAPYVAFEAKDKVVRLDIRCGESGLAHAVAYSFLLNFTYDRKTYREFFITVSGIMIMVKGRNLRPIVEAIRLHKCDHIQEFDASEFDAPSDSAAPFIESIDVQMMVPGRIQEESRSDAEPIAPQPVAFPSRNRT